jgi:hypothetical protein
VHAAESAGRKDFDPGEVCENHCAGDCCASVERFVAGKACAADVAEISPGEFHGFAGG